MIQRATVNEKAHPQSKKNKKLQEFFFLLKILKIYLKKYFSKFRQEVDIFHGSKWFVWHTKQEAIGPPLVTVQPDGLWLKLQRKTYNNGNS